jgi:hypothetical protein
LRGHHHPTSPAWSLHRRLAADISFFHDVGILIAPETCKEDHTANGKGALMDEAFTASSLYSRREEPKIQRIIKTPRAPSLCPQCDCDGTHHRSADASGSSHGGLSRLGHLQKQTFEECIRALRRRNSTLKVKGCHRGRGKTFATQKHSLLHASIIIKCDEFDLSR